VCLISALILSHLLAKEHDAGILFHLFVECLAQSLSNGHLG